MKKLLQLLLQLETNINKCNGTNTIVSAVPVGWHIEHSLLVINAVSDVLLSSNPAEYK